jgi:hypothetical protein
MASTPLRLNLGDGSVSFAFSPDAARDLQAALQGLLDQLKAIALEGNKPGQKPTPQKPVEYQHTGDVFFELFCNPNIWPSPFAAKVLITVRDERIRLSTEAELTRLLEDLNHYLEQS